MKIRSFRDNASGIIHIPRLLALTIPFVFIVMLHLANVFIDVPGWLMEPVIQIAILFTGVVIAVLGLSVGIGVLALLILVLWGVCIYYYGNFIAGWI